MRTKTPVLAGIRLTDSSGSAAVQQQPGKVSVRYICPIFAQPIMPNHAAGYELLAVSPLA